MNDTERLLRIRDQVRLITESVEVFLQRKQDMEMSIADLYNCIHGLNILLGDDEAPCDT